MKVKCKLSEKSVSTYCISVGKISIFTDMKEGNLIFKGFSYNGDIKLSRVESALASIRGYFAHKENMDKLIKLSDRKIHAFSTPTDGNPFFDYLRFTTSSS